MQLKILLMWFPWINYCKVSPILTIQMFWLYKVSLPLSLMLMAILYLKLQALCLVLRTIMVS